ncbi:hypothetical protein [Bacillus changyiensis]|uniref:hypothetical protein n=1 Tax=Bacillus changyiensis TaxID=3004103 RepID=UPI0022E8C535|nr:hypothetical protein [Bacillus changyiensis]MDA1475422.1 hypothetical protein [Bacillus changyiensis]
MVRFMYYFPVNAMNERGAPIWHPHPLAMFIIAEKGTYATLSSMTIKTTLYAHILVDELEGVILYSRFLPTKKADKPSLTVHQLLCFTIVILMTDL